MVESAVIGVPHRDFGEGVTAVVVADRRRPRSPRPRCSRRWNGRLAKFKLPKRVVFVDELPRNTMGKVQKNLLREAYGDLYQG